jgi:hypothetical protein
MHAENCMQSSNLMFRDLYTLRYLWFTFILIKMLHAWNLTASEIIRLFKLL